LYFIFSYPYLKLINIEKFRVSLSRLRVSAHSLEIETVRWYKPIARHVIDRTCGTNISFLED